MALVYYEGVGRRKTASARVRLYPGEGNIVVNDKPMGEYFPREGDVLHLLEPLKVTGTAGTFNISVKVQGGGHIWPIGGCASRYRSRFVEGRSKSAARFAQGRFSDQGCSHEGKKEAWAQARSQGAAVHQAVKLTQVSPLFRRGGVVGDSAPFLFGTTDWRDSTDWQDSTDCLLTI